MENPRLVRVMKKALFKILISLVIVAPAMAEQTSSLPAYKIELNIPYCTVNNKTETLNAFLPVNAKKNQCLQWLKFTDVGGSPATSPN